MAAHLRSLGIPLMSLQQAFLRAPWLARAHSALDVTLRACAFYLIPLLIALISLLALLFGSPLYGAGGEKQLELKWGRESGAPRGYAGLMARLDAAPAVTQFDSGLHLAPVWFTFTTRGTR